jgi:uncharacterized membrane protein YjjP (DUF1212 family)
MSQVIFIAAWICCTVAGMVMHNWYMILIPAVLSFLVFFLGQEENKWKRQG